MAGNHQVLIRLNHIRRDLAAGCADALAVFPVGRFIELEPQPSTTTTDRSAHRRCILADPGRKHDPVEAAESRCEGGDVSRYAIAKHLDGEARARIVTGQE